MKKMKYWRSAIIWCRMYGSVT